MKYVLLTGSSGGIGNTIAKLLLDNGYYVMGADLAKPLIVDKNYKHFMLDLTNEESVKLLKEEVLSLTDKIDAVINTVGIYRMESVVEGSVKDFRKILDINVMSSFIINKTFIPLLNKNGKIINLTSEIAIYSPQPFMAYYACSKKALDSYSDVLRRECNYLGIKVIKIQSGSMSTNMLPSAEKEFDSFIESTSYFKMPLTKLKYMMDKELKKTNDPIILAKLVVKILKKNNPRIKYRVKNSFALRFMNILPNRLQDYIYRRVIN